MRKASYAYEKRLLIKRDGKSCFYCGAVLSQETATVEHLIPITRHGSNSLENMVIACFDCNNTLGIMPLNRKVNFAIKTRVELILKNTK